MFCGRCSVASWRGKVEGWSSSSETRFIRSLIGAELFPADKTPGVVAPSPQHKQPHAHAHTHTHTHTRALRERERIERGWCANELPFPSPFRVFRSANKGSNSVDFRTCFSITNPREAAAAAGKEEKNGRETRGSG